MPAERSLIDVHVHLAVLGATPERGYVSRAMLRGAIGRWLSRTLGVPVDQPERLSEAYVARLRGELERSRFVRQAVLLALDGVYDAGGRFDLARTHLYVPNDAVLALARSGPMFLAGASVNPRRRDALDELARVAAAGAVLVKWLPNSQQVDPAEAAWLPFYRELVRLRLPLLVHSGIEFSVKAGAQAYGDPRRWRPALDQGVELIAAHAGSSGLVVWERHGRDFLDLLGRYPNLHADSSALLLPNRVRMLARLRRAGQLGRLTFGTDYPLPSFPALALTRLDLAGWRAARAERNHFDRQVRLFQALGWEPSSEVFERLAGALSPARGAR